MYNTPGTPRRAEIAPSNFIPPIHVKGTSSSTSSVFAKSSASNLPSIPSGTGTFILGVKDGRWVFFATKDCGG